MSDPTPPRQPAESARMKIMKVAIWLTPGDALVLTGFLESVIEGIWQVHGQKMAEIMASANTGAEEPVDPDGPDDPIPF